MEPLWGPFILSWSLLLRAFSSLLQASSSGKYHCGQQNTINIKSYQFDCFQNFTFRLYKQVSLIVDISLKGRQISINFQLSANNNLQQMEAKKSDFENKEVSFSKNYELKFDQFIRCNTHYQQAKRNFLQTNDKYSYAQSLANFNIEGYQDKHIRDFISNVKENDSRFKLQTRDINAIIDELLNMFKRLKQEIIQRAKHNDSEYHRILEENYNLFKERGRIKRYEGYCSIQRLVSLDLFGLLSKRNFEYESYQCGYRLAYFIPNKIIVQICEIPMSNVVYRSSKSTWEQYYYFVRQDDDISFFIPLVDLLILAHLKRKQTSTFRTKKPLQTLQRQENLKGMFKRPKISSFINKQPFVFRFCEIVILQSKFQDIRSMNQNEQILLKTKMDKILSSQQKARRHLQLRKLLFQNSFSLRSVIEWWNFFISDKGGQPEQQQIAKAMQHYNWQFLQQGGLFQAFKIKLNLATPNKKMQLDESMMNTIFCRMALKRTIKIANLLAIQNHIMIEADQQEPLYVRFFTYFYNHYSKIQENVDQKEKSIQSEAVSSILLGVVRNRIVFISVLNEKINQITFCQLITAILSKYKKRYSLRVCISEFSFSSVGFQEQTTRKILYFFKKRMKSFLIIDVRPTSYLLHCVVNSYIDEYLSSCQFGSEEQFSQAIARQSRRIIRLVNQNQITNQFVLNKIMMMMK